MISLFRKLSTFLRKLFNFEDKVKLKEEFPIASQKELIDKINFQKKNLAEKERRLNETRIKLEEYFLQLKRSRDQLIVSIKNNEQERKVLNEEIASLKYELIEVNKLKVQKEMDFLSLAKKYKQKEVELLDKEEFTNNLLKSSKISEQILQTDSIQINELKRITRELYDEKRRLQKILEEKEDRENQSQKLVDSIDTNANDSEEYTSYLQLASQKEGNIHTSSETNSDLPVEQNVELSSDPFEEESFEGGVANSLDEPITQEISKVLEHDPDSIGEMIPTKSRKIAPERRGGRSRISDPSELMVRDNVDGKTKKYKPKIVCWKEERIWKLAVELPDDFNERHKVIVSQNDVPLPFDERREGYFKLISVTGKIQVTSQDNSFTDLELGKDGFLIFKLTAGNPNEGNLVTRTSRGNYMAIVPSVWRFDESISGPQIAESEQTSLRDYSAYHYSFTKYEGKKIGFKNLNNEEFTVDTIKPFYRLEGNLIEDCAFREGPLFGENPPTIQVTDSNQWNKIQCIIIGEEGIDRNNWKKRIEINPNQAKIELPDHLTHNLSGWYFIRFYDFDAQLVDSCDFRFITSLLKIEYMNLCLIPDEGGFTDLNIELFHTSDFQLHHADYIPNGLNVYPSSTEKTTILIKSFFDEDKVEFSVSAKEGRNVKLFLPIERIWWSVNQGELPGVWKDEIVTLTPKDFSTPNQSVYIKYPKSFGVSLIKFGFQNKELRKFPTNSDSNYQRILLKEYSDSEFQMTKLGKHNMECELIYNGGSSKFIPFNVVVNAKCKFCNAFESDNVVDIINHIIEVHLELVYIEPIYDDIQPLLPHLPKRIYRCSHCPDENPTYVKAFSNNPVGEIIRHIDQEHFGKSHKFKIEDDIKEIEKIIAVEIPSYKKCVLCNTPIPETDLARHLLISFHENDLTVRP